MQESCEAALARHSSNASPLRTSVENIIAPLLPHAKVQSREVARRLGLSERTFARRLVAEGTTYGEILDQFRREIATSYLAETDLQISQIAWPWASIRSVLSRTRADAGRAKARGTCEPLSLGASPLVLCHTIAHK